MSIIRIITLPPPLTPFLYIPALKYDIPALKIWYYRKFKDRIERNSFAGTGGWIIGGGGGKGYVAPPPSQIIGGPAPPPLFLRLWLESSI